jgi:hypothetical protein
VPARPAALALALALAACDAARPANTPAGAVAAFVSAVESAERDPAQRRRVYELLSQRARAGLDERAARASQVSGRTLAPWEMIAPGRLRLRVSVAPDALTARESGDRAVVTARGRAGGVADVPLVREGGRWRVDLALPPIVAPGPGER